MKYVELDLKSLYVDEIKQIAKILEALNGVQVLQHLDGVVKHYSENADLLASFWYDSEHECWRVYIGPDDIEGSERENA